MRTFKKIQSFGAGLTGATGGKSNEAILFLNTSGGAANITVQSLNPQGNIERVGPFNLANNQSFIYPLFAYGWTGSAAGISAWQLF